MTTTDVALGGRLRHIPALDGLRGIAVIGVLFFHAGHLRGGFLGVDLFFVLSGFLITSLLLLERDGHGYIALTPFWGRRARRLLPAMFAVVFAATVLAPFVLRDDELRHFKGSALASLGYVANWWAVARDGDYFALFDSPAPLDHFWSLAIEEQFYVFWPLVVAAALAFGSRRIRPGSRTALAVLIGVGTAASWITMIMVADEFSVTRAYYGTDTRAGALLLGALAATWTAGRDRTPSQWERGIGMAAVPAVVLLGVGWTVASGSDLALFRWGLPLHAFLVVVVVLAITGPAPGLVGRVLAVRGLRAAGVISYGLYLWHWPVYVWLDPTRTGLDGWSLTLLRLSISTLVAVASYRLIEQPVRLGRWPQARAFPISLAAAVACALVVVAVIPSGGGDEIDLDRAAIGGTADGGVGLKSLLLVGDSGAAALGDALSAVGRAEGISVKPNGVIGCGLVQIGDGVAAPDGSFYPDPAGCDDWPVRFADLVEQEQPDLSLLVLSWGGVGDRDLGGDALVGPCDPGFDAMYRTQVQLAVDTLSAQGGQVAIATTAPNALDRNGDARTACLNAIYRSVTDANADALLVDLADWTCPANSCAPTDTRRPDGVHYADQGAVDASKFLLADIVAQRKVEALPKVILAGDSQAFRLVDYAPDATELGVKVAGAAQLGCGLSPDDVQFRSRVVDKSNCRAALAALPGVLTALKPDLIVVHTGVWESLDAVVGGVTLAFGTPEWTAHNQSVIGTELDRMQAVAPVVVLTTPCFTAGEGTSALETDDLDARVAAVNQILVAAAQARGIEVIDFGAFVCPPEDPAITGASVPDRPDGLHLSAAGGRDAWIWLAPQLVAAARQK